MANSYEQLEYLRQMRQRKNESSKYGSFVNQNDIEDIYNNLASAAKLDTDLEMVGYNEPDFSKYLKKESSGNQKVDQALSGWKRTVDTINAVGYNIGSGLLNFLDSIGDFVFNTIDFLGGNVEWAQEARDYNWQDKTNAFLNATGSLLNGDMFDGSYFKALSSAEEAADYKNKIVNESNWLSELDDVNNFMSGVEESIGFMLPSIVAGVATGGSSLAAQAASMGVNAAKVASLATMFAGASASSLNEVYKETGDYGKAFAVGALKGLVEVGTELIFPESGVLGIVGGKEVTIGFKEFSKAMGKEFFEEGVEEVISALIEPAIYEIWKSGSFKDAYIDNPAKFLFGVGGDFNSSVLGQGLAGGVSGILMGGTSQIATNAQIDSLVGKDGRALIAKGQALSEVLNKYLTDKAKTKVVNGERISAYTEEQLMAKYEDELGKAGAEWLKEWANVKDKLTSKQKANLAMLIENPTQALEEAKIDSEEDLSNFIERTISNSSDITKQNAMNLTKRINQVFKSNIQTDFVSEDVINDRQALEKQVGSLTDEEYEQFKNTGEAFLRGNKIILKESLKNEYNRLIAHEALSHGILDSNIELRNRLLTDLSKNDSFIKEWKKQFQENKKAKDIVDLYDLPQELRNVDSKNNVKFVEAIEEMNSEQMASFVEYILSNKNLLDTLTTVSSNNLKTIIRRSIDALKGVKNSSTNKALKLLENTLKNIKTTAVKTTTNQTRTAYSKKNIKFSMNTKNEFELTEEEIKEFDKWVDEELTANDLITDLEKEYNITEDTKPLIREELKDFSRTGKDFVEMLNLSLSNEVKQYFKDSVVKSNNAVGWFDGKKDSKYLIPMYHGTPSSDMYFFDPQRIGTNGTQRGVGFYLINNFEYAQSYNDDGKGKVIVAFVNITKPLSDTKLTITRSDLSKLIRKIDSNGDGYLSNYGDINSESYNTILNKAIDNLLDYQDTDVDLINEIYYIQPDMSFDEFFKTLKDTLGYDGAIFANRAEGTVVVAYNSNQIKDINNIKPTTNSDIRFSKSAKNFQNDKKTNQNNKIVDKTETTNYNESVYSVNVAPYKYFNGNETTIPAVRRFIEGKYLENANRILKAIGLEKYLVTNNVGGYEFSGGKYVGLSANEISYRFNLIGATLEQTELFACLMADLGHETQEAVIFSSYVNDNDSSKNGNEYVIHLNIKEYKDKIVEIAKKNGVINYTYADKDGTFKVNLIDGFATEQDVINFGRFIDKLKKEGYVDEQTKQQRKAINSRYYGADDRRSVYEKWAKIGSIERHGWQELSNLLSEAKERARIEIEKSKIEEQISDIIKKNQNIDKYIKDDKIKLNKIVDREQVKYVIERNEYSEPLFQIAELVYKETEYEKNFVLKILTDTAKDNSIKWEENKNAQSLRKSITSIADRMYRNISKKGMEYFTPFKLHDLFRTTYIFDGLNVNNMENVVEELKPYLLVQSNNDIVKVNNTEYGYKGIHLNLKIQDIPVEIQLHSKESWKIKELQDSIYDKNRSAKVVNQEELEYSKSLNKDLDDLYNKLKAKAEEINSKFKKENKIKLSRSAKVDKLSFKNIQTTKDIVSDTKTYLENALGDNYKISFAGGFNTFVGKAFSKINSSTVIATETNRVVDLLLDSTVEQINTDNGTFVKVGKLSELIDATQKEQLISAITNLIENAENEEAKNQFTLGLEKQLNKLSDKTKEVGDRNERIRVLTNARTKIRKEIDRYHVITDDDVSRNGLKTLLQPFEQLHGSKGGFTSKGLKANINQTLAWYTEENINKNFSDLPYSDEIRNAFIDLYDSIGEPKQIVKTDSDGNEFTVESYTSLSTDSINKAIKAIELINEAIKKTNNNLITKIKPAANSSYETIKNMSYGKKRTFVRKIFESYKRGFAPAYTVLKEVLGGNSRLAKVLTYDTQNAVNKKIMYVGSYSDEINKKLKELGLKKVFDTKTYIVDGHKLTLDQTLGAYISLQVAINYNEINKHGFKYKDSDSGRVITLTEAGQAAALKEKIEKTLTKEEKLFGDFLLSTMNTSVKAEYIEWFENRFGKFNGRNEIGKVGENTYWFLNRAYMLASNIEKAVKNPNGMFSHANSRTKNDNAILLCGALSGFNGYIEQLGTELFLKPVYKEALQILNTKTSSGSTVFKLLNESIDTKDVQYIMNTMQDILGATPKQNDLLSKIMSTFSVAKLSLNIGSMGKQFASIFTSNIPLRDSTKALLLKVFQNPEAKAEYRKLFDEIGGLKYRESNKGIIRANADSLSGVGEKIAKGGMIGISKVDMFTISTGVYSLMVIGQNEYGFPIGSKENIDFVKEHWAEFELSQIGNSALSKNALARGEYGNTTKALFGFMQGANRAALGSLLNKIGLWNRNHDVDVQPIKVELEAVKTDIKTIEEEHTTDGKFDTSTLDEKATEKYIELKTKETTLEEQLKDYDSYKIAGGKYIPAQIAAGLVAQGIFIGLITELMRHIKGKKDWDEWDLKELGLNITLSTSVDWIPFLNAISNVIKGYEFTVPSVEVLNEFVDIVNNAKNKNWKTFSRELITLLGDMTGIPVTTLYDYMYGTIKTFDPETAYKLNSLLYNTSLQSTTRTLNQYVEKGKESKSLTMVDIIMKNYKTTGSNVINTEINRLYLEGFTNAMPKSYMSSYTDNKGNTVELTKEQIELFRSIYNQADKAAEKALALADYKTKTSAEQAKILKKIYDTYYNYAKAKVLKQTKADSKISTLLLYTNGKLNVSKLSSVLEIISSIKDTKNKTRKELVIEYVNRLNVSSETKLLILNLAGYTSVSNNNRLKNYLRQLGVSNKNIESYFA